jgi:hypothetical protein|tara:strand:+ start:1084 stop:1257 length:174 start_codon:yes stop_codon:yes gene_type:complete
MSTQAQLEAHERECKIFREMTHDKLNTLDRRMWRIEALAFTAVLGLFTLGAIILQKL